MAITSGPAASERKARLDQESVILAAETLVDRDGYDALTMTLLASELDTRVSSLYNHVANLEELRATIQVRAMRLLSRHVQRSAMGHSGADGIGVMARELRAFVHRNPQRYAALTREPLDRDAFFEAAGEVIEALAIMVRSTGMAEEKLIHTGMAIFSALHGFVTLEISGYFGGVPELDSVYEQVIQGAVAAAVA